MHIKTPANVLEADPSLIESSLRIVKDDVDNGLIEAVMQGDVDTVQKELEKNRSYRVITPEAGICIKIHTLIDRRKFFINICQHDAIPQPEPITADALIEQLNSPTEATYRIPMSISELRECLVKDVPAQCCDCAVHPKFLAKSQAEELFGDFLIQVLIEAIDAKYGIQLDGGQCVILKNRKVMGTLVRHRIKNRDLESVLEATERRQAAAATEARQRLSLPLGPAVQQHQQQPSNLLTAGSAPHRRPLIEELPAQAAAASPQASDALAATTRLVHDRANGRLLAEFYLPNVLDAAEIQTDVGEDRVRVQVPRLGVLREYHVAERMDAAGDVQTEWMAERSLLVVRIPVRGD